MNHTRILKKEQRSPSSSRTRTRSIYRPGEERRQTPRRSQIQGLSRFRGHEGQNGDCMYFWVFFFSSNFSLGRWKTSKRNQRQLSIPIEGWWRWSFWWVFGRLEERIRLDQILRSWQGQGWLSNCCQGQLLCFVFYKTICLRTKTSLIWWAESLTHRKPSWAARSRSRATWDLPWNCRNWSKFWLWYLF